MKSLVTYYSETKNTEKLAKAIYDGIDETTKDIVPISEADPEGYDVIFIGFPVIEHSVPGKVGRFIKSVPDSTKLAFFSTHGSMRGGQLAITAMYHALSLAVNHTILGTFGCRGQVKPALLEMLSKKLEHRAWTMEAQSANGHPDTADLEDGKKFAESVIAKARAI